MYYAITFPLAILLSIGIGFLTAKKFESISTGKILSALSMMLFTMLVFFIKYIVSL